MSNDNCVKFYGIFIKKADVDRFQQEYSGLIAIAVIALCGIVHNIILLLIANRIKWFSYYQFFLLVNQAIADMLTCFTWAFGAIRMLLGLTPSSNSEINCILIHLPANILLTCSQMCALTVAFDRLLSLLAPHRWVRFGQYYRYGLIAFAWLSSIVQEALWFFGILFLDFNKRSWDGCDDHHHILKMHASQVYEIQCIRHPDPIPNLNTGPKQASYNFAAAWFRITMIVLETVTMVLILLFYIVIPLLARKFCERVICGQEHVQIYWSGMEEQERKILIRVRLMGFLTLATFFSTSFLGMVYTDFFYNQDFGEPIGQTIAIAVSLLNTIFPIYLFTWKDEAFRKELIKLKLFVCDCLKCRFQVNSSNNSSNAIATIA